MRAFSLLATALLASAGSQKPGPGDNEFEFVNRCNSALNVTIASFPFNPAYTGAQPGILRRHDSAKVIVPVHFNGHFLTGASGSTVEYTAGVNQQLYVINNSDGFTVGISVEPKTSFGLEACPAVTCAAADCACSQAIPPATAAPCDLDATVACFADKGYKVTFCP